MPLLADVAGAHAIRAGADAWREPDVAGEMLATRNALDIAEFQHQEDRQESADPGIVMRRWTRRSCPHCWASVVSRCRICSSSPDSRARQSSRMVVGAAVSANVCRSRWPRTVSQRFAWVG
jgi:hypothetical protein